MRSIATLLIALAGALAAPAMAQDIPGRVGRVAFIEGTAAVYSDPESGWERAYVNSPLTSENSIWTDPGARAEVRVGGTAVRLDQATQLDVARLDDQAFEAFVPRGTISVRVRHYQQGRDLVFDTPHARFKLRADGRYRIDVDPDLEESRITVFAGDARVGSDSGRLRAKAGETVRVFGGAQSSYVVERAFSDPFDTWSTQRDARWVETRSVQYVSPEMTGYEDLDNYGNWSQDPNYGAVWYPTRVASDWAPYRYGRWDYVRPWGWTWIDDSPWGYAPFHYGRWVSVNNRWAWYPGKREVQPVWAPALVAWIGGSNFSVGVSTGSPSVGWYPLSPYDRYQPWYNASPTYVNQVNVVVNNYVVNNNNSNPQRRQENTRVQEYNRSHGATVVNRETVVDRRPVQQARVSVRPEALAAAAVVTAAAVLPARNEVVQRRVAQRTQEPAKQPAGPAPRAGQATVAGANNTPAARPEFKRAPAVATATPKPAEAPPAPARRVSAPSATPAARPERAAQPATPASPASREAQPAREQQQQAREQQQQAREQQSREAQQKQQQERAAAQQQNQEREAQQKQAREQQQQAREQQSREAQQKQQQDRAAAQQQQQQSRDAQQKQQQDREAQQKQAREQQQQAREQQTREAQQKQQQDRAAAQQQQQAREAQTREAQQKQQQERAAAQQQQQQSREAQQKQQQERAAAQQQQQQQAREAQQKQQQERAAAQQQQQQAREPQQKPQQQQPAERAQRTSPPPPPARTREEQAAKDKKDKEDEEKKKSGR